jgi:hypothetical protein
VYQTRPPVIANPTMTMTTDDDREAATRCSSPAYGSSLHRYPALPVPVELAIGRDLRWMRRVAHSRLLFKVVWDLPGQPKCDPNKSAGGLLKPIDRLLNRHLILLGELGVELSASSLYLSD